MGMKKIINILIIIFSVLIFDYLLTFLFISKFNFYENFYPKLNHRIANVDYHHSFKENINTLDYWGENKYKFITNSIGFKDKLQRKINKKSDFSRRIIFNGDSFTEGIGYEYKNTFVGLLDSRLKNEDIEILNAGVASQSPILYFKKIKHLVEVEGIQFNELILFLDISDIPDEFYYEINYNDDDIKINSIRSNLQDFVIQNFSTYLFVDILFSKLDLLKKNLFLRYEASKEFELSFFKINSEHKNLYKSIKVKRGNWTHNDNLWNFHGSEGRKLAEYNLNNLSELCDKYNIKLTLVIYPWPSQIYYDYRPERHRNYWKKWSKMKNINFIDLFEFFENDNPQNIISTFFIPGDVHWNKKGHQLIYDIILNKYFNK